MDCCPVLQAKKCAEFRDALSTAEHRLMDGVECDNAIFKEALGLLAQTLREGCAECRRRTIALLHKDLGWPRHAQLQELYLRTWLDRIRANERAH